MSTPQQLKLLLVSVLFFGAGTHINAQPELRQTEHNRVVLELPTFNFTRIYNEVPLINLGRLYNRLFNATKEKPAESEESGQVAEVANPELESRTEQIALPYPFNGFFDPASGIQRSNQVLNVQIPNQPGQQLFGGFGYNYGLGAGPGHSHEQGPGFGYGYGYPDYAQIYGSNNYNSIPGVQVLQQPFTPNAGFGFDASNYYNYVNLNNDRIRQGYRRRGYNLQNADFNDGRGQLYADFAPYRQWLQRRAQQQQLAEAQAYEEALDYGEEDEIGYDDGLANEFDESDDYGMDDYGDRDEADYGDGDYLWRQADADSKAKIQTKTKTKTKTQTKSQSQLGTKLKAVFKKRRVQAN